MSERQQPAAPEHKPIDAIALGKEVALDRLEHLIEWAIARLQAVLVRLRRWRESRGNWWE